MSDDSPSADSKPQLRELIRGAQQMQQELGKVQEDLAHKVVEGSAGGGMVVARVNGRQQLLSLQIEDNLIDTADREMLQDLIVAAVNQALVKATELAKQDLNKVAGGMLGKIPGLGL